MSSHSPKMYSQTDLGGRPPKFGRTIAALEYMHISINYYNTSQHGKKTHY